MWFIKKIKKIRTMCRNFLFFGLYVFYVNLQKQKPCARFLVLTLKHFASMRHALLFALKIKKNCEWKSLIMLLLHVAFVMQKIKPLDGIDLRTRGPSHFSTKWRSFKFNRPGLWHEIAIEAKSGNIFWAYGGFPCGSFPDLIITRKKCVQLLRHGER